MTIAAPAGAVTLSRFPVTFTPVGLIIEPGRLSGDEYDELGDELKKVHNATIWWWGDYLNSYQRDWGERYSQALSETEYAYQTLRNAKWVCGKVGLSNRLDKLGFAAHQIVASLDGDVQGVLLHRALAEGWTQDTLQLAVRQERDPFAQPGPDIAMAAAYERERVQRAALPDILDWISAHPQAAETIAEQVATVKANHQLINASTNNEWYTPAPFLQAAHDLMGGIDLDPASTPFANQVVRASRIYTEDDDGLSQRWAGRLWLNPPYGIEDGESNQSKWSRRLIESYRAGDVTEALLLVNAVTGNQWFSPLKDFPICFPDARIRFYNETTEAGQPTHSNAIIYFGPQLDRFASLFGRFGAVMATREVWDGCR